MRPYARRWLGVAGIVAFLYAALCGALFALVLRPPDEFGRIMARIPKPFFALFAIVPFETLWNLGRGGALSVGDLAPDFDLARIEGHAVEGTDATPRVRLSSFRGTMPVVLVFGSFT